MKTGGENLQQVYNRGLDFILNTYGSAENIIPSKNVVPILSRGIVIEVDFNNQKNYKSLHFLFCRRYKQDLMMILYFQKQ